MRGLFTSFVTDNRASGTAVSQGRRRWMLAGAACCLTVIWPVNPARAQSPEVLRHLDAARAATGDDLLSYLQLADPLMTGNKSAPFDLAKAMQLPPTFISRQLLTHSSHSSTQSDPICPLRTWGGVSFEGRQVHMDSSLHKDDASLLCSCHRVVKQTPLLVVAAASGGRPKHKDVVEFSVLSTVNCHPLTAANAASSKLAAL